MTVTASSPRVLLLACATCVCGLLSMPAEVCAQGDLFRARQAVRSGSDNDDDDDDDHHHHRKHRHHHYDDCDDDDWGWEALVGELAAYVITSPFWVPYEAVDEGFDVPGHFYHHPYDRNGDGLMQIGGYDRPANDLTRFDIEYAVDFDDLERFGGQVLWEHTNRFGVDASVNCFQEDLAALGNDQLWLGDVNLVYRFAQCENFAMRAGLGVNWMADDTRGDAGFNFTYGADWFPAEPLVVSTVIDWGTLGDATLFHGRATIGVVHEHVEFYTGYDYYDLDGVGLGTVVAGIRIWF